MRVDGDVRRRGRTGMSADQTLRALVVKQLRQFSCSELVPLRSALPDSIRRISAPTLELSDTESH